jgi:transposase
VLAPDCRVLQRAKVNCGAVDDDPALVPDFEFSAGQVPQGTPIAAAGFPASACLTDSTALFRFMDHVIEDLPEDKEVHVILDNYCTHKKNDDWLKKHNGRVQFHFTPTSASWLNQIEIWLGILSRKTLKGASFRNVTELKNAIEAYIVQHNQKAQPFKWRRREVKGSQIKNTITNLCN